jgi:hypothetical protein
MTQKESKIVYTGRFARLVETHFFARSDLSAFGCYKGQCSGECLTCGVKGPES